MQHLSAPVALLNLAQIDSLAAVAAARTGLDGSTHSHRIAGIVGAMPEAKAALARAAWSRGEAELFLAEDEGWACWYRPMWRNGDNGPGVHSGPDGCELSDPWLFDAEAWEDYHGGHEATPDYLLAARDAANDEITSESDAGWDRRGRRGF